VTLAATDAKLGQHVSTIVAAYAGNNQIAAPELPRLVQFVYDTLARLAAGTQEAHTLAQEPAVPTRKSVFSDYIVCLEDGKKLLMLKRHLRLVYNMTPQEYRTKWGLPASYPMTAPRYAERRSALAKSSGLGQKKEPVAERGAEPVIQQIPERRRGARAPRSAQEA
jgi:predicted transcriptional regulator